MSSSKSKFKSDRLSGRRVFLTFESIGDSYWTDAEKLRAMVAELDRLGVADDADLRLRHWPDDDNEMRVRGWTLGLLVPEPAVCRHCLGARQVTLAADPGVLWPCPTCCCHVCGQPTDTPPECGTCANRDEAQAKRRADQ